MKKKIIVPLIIVFVISISYFIVTNNSSKRVKYVFLFIGDGMNINHVELTEAYNNTIKQNDFESQEKLSFSEFQNIGLRKNHDKYNYVPDSASSATALSSGLITKHGMLNIDDEGNRKTPIPYLLKEKRKMKIGIITTVPIHHATPAAFYSYNTSRINSYDIAKNLVNSNFDYFGDGGFDLNSQELSDIEEQLQSNHYRIIDSKEEIENLKKTNDKIIAINPNVIAGTSKYAMETSDHDLNFNDFVRVGINVLDNKKGFFMMAESGMIDFASHNNDARAVISEVNVLDEAVKEALKFYKKHPKETLIIVTGDHETGGLALGNYSGFGLDLTTLQNQKVTFSSFTSYINATYNNPNFDEILNYLMTNFGIGTSIPLTEEDQNKLKNYYELKDTNQFVTLVKDILYKETKIGWTTDNHTASPIVVYAKGVKSEEFTGKYTSTQFNQKLKKVLGV